MDSVFLLGPEPRGRFLRSAARALGCSYICLWSYLPHPSNCLVSMDGWFHEDDTGHPSSSSGSLPQRLFDAYRASFCSVESRCVPGLAYKEGLPYIQLEDSDLMSSASMQSQRQFYQEAGIKTAVFMGCKGGEIELGVSTSRNINMQMNVQQLFAEDYLQQWQLGELPPPEQSRHSSSSSSLRSLSVGSPEYCSSLFLSKAGTSFDALKEVIAEQATRPTASPIPPCGMMAQAYSQYPTPTSDDAAMTRAMLAVIASAASSSSPPPPPPPPPSYHPPQQPDQTYGNQMSHRPMGAFKAYKSGLAPKFESKRNPRSQRMIKLAISTLRRINLMRLGPSSNQLHHMISERKRREKLNESFDALRMLLPPGSKKDKASVLANTRVYVNTLRAQISELKERNRALEAQLPASGEAKDAGDSSERIEVRIARASQSTSEVQRIDMRIIARAECDMIDFVLCLLECLKEMRSITLESMDVSTCSPHANVFAQANLTMQIKTSDWDEEAFKEAVIRAVDGVVTHTATATP